MTTENPEQPGIPKHKDVAEYSAELSRLRENLLISRSLDAKLRLISDAIVSIFCADFARIWMIKPADLCERGCIHAGVTEGPHACRNRTSCLHLIASSGRYTRIDGGHRRVPMGAYKIGRVAAGAESGFITNDVANDPRVHDHEWARSLGLVSFAGFRLISSDGRPTGVLALFRKRALEPHEGKLLEDLAGTISLVIQTGTAEEALRKAHDDLEIRVQERTAALRESEERLVLKLDSILSPETDLGDLELAGILDIAAIQSLMEDFTRLTGMGTGVLDLKGNVIVATGWQDICTKFHRVNEQTARYCTESDLFLACNLKAGEYVAYRCRNNLWDVVTPLYIGNRHIGNIYTGQFFYDDETVDENVFVAQAEEYGFNRDEYLSALRHVPRFSRRQINDLMDYLVKFTAFISRLSHSNLKLARTMAEGNRVKEALELSERRLSDIINHLPDATLAIDREGRVITWNKAMEEMTGVTAGQMLGKGNYEYALPFYGYRRPILVDWIFESDEELEKRYTILQREGDLIVAEVDLVLPDGRSISLWGKATPLHDETGTRIGAIESIRDVTDRKRAEQALMRQTQFLQRLLDAIPTPIFYKNREGVYTGCNTAFGHYLGLPPEQIVGKTVYDISPGNLADIYHRADEDLFVSRKEQQYEASVKYADGTLHDVIFYKAPFYDERGQVAGLIGSILDITDRKRAEDDLRKLYSELEQRVTERTAELRLAQDALYQANRKLNLLSGITRHDIRNQLIALSGYLELSGRSLEDPARTAEFIAKEKKIAETISRQISFTKEYEDLGVKAPAWQNVHAIILNMVARLPVRDIRVDAGDPDLEVFADPLLEKVFYNLIDNALRYGGEQMTVIRVTTCEENGNLKIMVGDDGRGIGIEDKSHLFTKGFGKHTGLGLFLSREILSITGITITENGEPGKGARFEIVVPVGGWRIQNNQ